jgi:hypothetical protein
MTRIVAILIAASLLAASLLGMSPSAIAAPRDHRSASPYRAANHHRPSLVHRQPRIFEPRYAPDAYGFQPPGYGMPYSSTEERWFDQAKGNIW